MKERKKEKKIFSINWRRQFRSFFLLFYFFFIYYFILLKKKKGRMEEKA